MDKPVLVGIIISTVILSIAFILTPVLAGREMSIPPTHAFSRIITDNGVIYANEWNDYVDMRTTDDVNITMSGHRMYIHGVNSTGSSDADFGTITINGNSYSTSQSNGTITINTQGSLSCTKSGNTFTCKLSAITCPVLQGIKGVDANGNLFCAVI